MKRRLKILSILIISSVVAIGYTNCSPEHSGDGSSSSFSKTCNGLDEMGLFTQTYHTFLMKKCATCHISGGAGPGEFASSGTFQAWNSFSQVGVSKMNEKALDGHSSSSGGQNKLEVDIYNAKKEAKNRLKDQAKQKVNQELEKQKGKLLEKANEKLKDVFN